MRLGGPVSVQPAREAGLSQTVTSVGQAEFGLNLGDIGHDFGGTEENAGPLNHVAGTWSSLIPEESGNHGLVLVLPSSSRLVPGGYPRILRVSVAAG